MEKKKATALLPTNPDRGVCFSREFRAHSIGNGARAAWRTDAEEFAGGRKKFESADWFRARSVGSARIFLAGRENVSGFVANTEAP